MSGRRLDSLAWTVVLLAAATSIAALVVHAQAAALTGSTLELYLADAWAGLLYPAVGAWLVSRRRAAAAAAVMLGASLLAVSGLGLAWATFDVADGTLSPGGQAAAWVATWTWVPYLLLPTALPLFYARSVVRRPAGRWLAGAALALVGVVALLSAFAPGPISDGAAVDNPLGVTAWAPWVDPLSALPGVAILGLAPATAVVLVVSWVRRRPEPGVRAAALGAVAFTTAAVTAGALPHPWSDVWTAVGATILPVAIIADQRVRDLRMEQTVARQRMIVARDAERDRLRQDLHDGVGPQLAGLALRVDGLAGEAAPELAGQLRTVGHALRDAVQEVRRIVDGLAPLAVDQLGLVGALRTTAEHLAPESVRVESDELPPLTPGVEVAAYRIALEALGNALRHARAAEVRVRLWVDAAGDLRLRVSDDGLGGAEARADGLGIVGMAARAEALGGRVDVHVNVPRGTVVEAVLPGRPG